MVGQGARDLESNYFVEQISEDDSVATGKYIMHGERQSTNYGHEQ